MEGHEPYPDLDSDNDEKQIMENIKSGQLLIVGCSSMNRVIHKCWAGRFDSAEAVLFDLAFLCTSTSGGWGTRINNISKRRAFIPGAYVSCCHWTLLLCGNRNSICTTLRIWKPYHIRLAMGMWSS